jgi:hypothetical protein
MRPLAWLFLLLGFIACGSDGPTGAGSSTLNGSWRFTFTNMSGVVQEVTVTCTATSIDFRLTQSGNSFSGIQVGTGRITCSAQGDVIIDEPIDSETIVNGTINGANVSFRLGSVPGQHTGTRSGTSITGTATWEFTEEGVTITLNGQFTAAKL